MGEGIPAGAAVGFAIGGLVKSVKSLRPRQRGGTCPGGRCLPQTAQRFGGQSLGPGLALAVGHFSAQADPQKAVTAADI